MSTEFLGLSLTDASEISMTFLEWRQSIDGVGVNSNMELIDGAIKLLNENLAATSAAKADGFTLDPDTGVLQLTSGGEPLDGASVTINLNKYYTKDEVDEFLADLEAKLADNETIDNIYANALGNLTWDEENRALTMYNMNGDIVGNSLIIEGGGGDGGGTGNAYSIRLVNGMPAASLTVASSAETYIKATYYEYYGLVETGENGELVVEYKLSTEKTWTPLTTMNVQQGVQFQVDVTDILTLDAKTNVRLTVTGGESKLTRALTYDITQIEARIADINFDSSAAYTGNFNFQYTCIGRNLSKVVHFEIDGADAEVVDVGTSHNATLTQAIQMLGAYDYGTHDMRVYFETPDGAKSNILRYAILYNDGTKTDPIIGVVPVREEITYGDSMDINYVVYTPGQETTDELNIRVYEINDEGKEVDYVEKPLVDIPNSTMLSWQNSLYPSSGTAYIEFTSGNTVELVTVKVNEIETDYDLNTITSNLVYRYNAAGRSNNDGDRDLYQYAYTTADGVTTNIRGTFDNFNWISNGYVDGESLTLSGGATHTIELPIFSTTYVDSDGQTVNLESKSDATVKDNGRTIEIEFKVSNVTDINAHIIRCMSSTHAGFVVTPQNCWLLSSNGTDVALDETGFIENEESIAAAYIRDGKRLRLSFVIEALKTIQYTTDDGTEMSGQCVDIYINGQYANSFVYPDNAAFTSEEFIQMGSDTCIVNLYDVRIYNRGLSAAEIMQNYCASPLSVQDRLLRFEDNDVLTDEGDVDYYKAIDKYNCLLVTGPLSPYKGANGPQSGRDGKYECGLTLTKVGTNMVTNGIIVTLEEAHGYDLSAVQDTVWTDDSGWLWVLSDLPDETQISFARGDGNELTEADDVIPATLTCSDLSLTITPYSVTWDAATYNHTVEFDLLGKDDSGVWLCSNNVQGTSSQKFPIKNYKMYLVKAVENEDGTTGSKKVKYALKGQDADGNDLSIGESTLCWKADYMSSDHANTFNANLADTLFTDKTPAQEENPLVQNTVWGFRCLLFQRDDENSEIRFAGDGALNNDKGNSKSFGLEDDSDSGNDTKCQKWEFLNNTEDICKFKTDVMQALDAEGNPVVMAALESTYPDQGDLEDEGLIPNYDHIQVLYTWVCQRANFWDASSDTLETPLTYNGVEYTTERDYRKAIFINEFDRHFNRNHALVYYLFMEFVALCDNRGKNLFLQSFDVRSESLLNVNGEAMTIQDAIDSETGEVNADMIDWENSTFAVWYTVLYDLDSCFGVENSGYMWIPYYANWDYTLNGAKKFNSYDSTLWLMFEEAMADDIMAEAQLITNRNSGAGGLNYDALYDVHIKNNAELVCSSVVNRDMTFKYSDPWVNGFINYALEGNPKQYISDYKYMQRGSRTQQKDAFIYRRSNMLYSKYRCDKFLNNRITFRSGANLSSADTTLTVTANQVLYPAARFSDTSSAVLAVGPRTEAGVPCTIQKPGTAGVGQTDTVYVAGGTFLTDIGDISKFHPYEIQLQNATGLRRLIIGSSEEGYENTQLTGVQPAECKLLEEINLMGCTSLSTVDLSYNGLLKKVYAGNSSATSISLPNGGVLEELYLGSVSDLTVLNHTGLTAFGCDSYDAITTLWVENTPIIPTQTIVETRLSSLTGGLRLVGVDWTLDSTELLERLVSSEAQGRYITSGGVLSENKSAYPHITGTIHINTIGTYLLSELNKIYPDLVIDATNTVEQYVVEFQNWDGTVLDTQLVLRGSGAVDPVKTDDNPNGWIDVPTRPSTVSTSYTFSGWDGSFAIISANTVITAVYSETTREYTVRWLNGTTVLQTETVLYGHGAEYTGITPTDTTQEDYLVYRLFNGWSKNTYFVDSDIDTYAQFTQAEPPADKSLSEMNPTELYALIKTGVLAPAGTTNTLIASGDTIDITLGCDLEYEGITSYPLIPVGAPETYDGTNYRNTGIRLFDEDKAFTLAVDFQFAEETATTVMASCYDGNGFTLGYDTSPTVKMATSTGVSVASGTGREIVVIRKALGDSNLYVYASNRAKAAIIESTITNSVPVQHDAPLSFGANIRANGYVDGYAKGTIYWAKLWMADLGAGACRKLACWTRNTLTLQAAGNSEYAFRMFKRADNDLFVNCCFLTENLLDICQQMNTTSTNAGGWQDSFLRSWLNTRVYEAIPDQWRLIMALINMNTSNGSNTIKINTTEDYIFVPPCKALGFFTTTSPYASEAEATFDLFSSTTERIKYLDNGNGDASDWWTASAYYSTTNTSGTSSYFHVVNESGSSTIASPSGDSVGVCFGFCI